MRKLLLTLAAFASMGAALPTPTDGIDAVARDYLILALGARELDPSLLSVNRSDEAALSAAKSANRDKSAIAIGLEGLKDRLDGLSQPADPLQAMRKRHLRAMIVSLRLQLVNEKPARVADQVRDRFGFNPTFDPLAKYESAISELETKMPGPGSIGERIGALRATAIVPKDRISAVFLAAMTECKRRTVEHGKLPAETVEVRFVPEPTFPGGNEYQGGGKSITQISTDFPQTVDNLLILACHEVYPGHHVHYLTMDAELAAKRGWREFNVDLNAGPTIPVAEGVAETATGIAFSPDERVAFERDTLYPLAGLKMQHIDQWRAYWAAKNQVLGATSTVARDYLDGKISADEAKLLFTRYRLQDPRAAEQLIKVLGAVGSYVIASDLGWQAAERSMRGKSRDEQWRTLRKIESEPMLLDDVAALR